MTDNKLIIDKKIRQMTGEDVENFSEWCINESSDSVRARKFSHSGIEPYDDAVSIALRASFFHIDNAARCADHSNPANYGIAVRNAEKQQIDKLNKILKNRDK
jgi:hypothetical protein